MRLSQSNSLLAAVVGLACGAAAASGAIIPVLNPSFEEPGVADDGNSTFATGYGFAGNPSSGGGGVYDPTDAQYTGATGDNSPLPGTATGGQAAYINRINIADGEGFLFQNFESETVDPNEVFTLTVAVGNRADLVDDTFAIRLVTFAGTLLAQTAGDAEALPSGTFTDVSATSIAGVGVGETGLQLQLVNTNLKDFNPQTTAGIQVNFDNVRLTSTLIPEPASISLLGLAGLGAMRRRRRTA